MSRATSRVEANFICSYMNAARIGQMLGSLGIKVADAVLYPAY